MESFGLIMVVVKVLELENSTLARIKKMGVLLLTSMFVARKVCENHIKETLRPIILDLRQEQDVLQE